MKPRVVKGFVQHIHYHVSVLCYEASVRQSSQTFSINCFCDAYWYNIVALPKENGAHPTIHYYAVVIKHPNEGKSPLAVAEKITEDHTIQTYHSSCKVLEELRVNCTVHQI